MASRRRSTRSRKAAPGRSVRNWAGRLGLASLALVLGTMSVAGSFAQVLKSADPVRAAALAPDDGQILAARALQEFTMAPSDDDKGPVAGLARHALLADPTAVDALTVLGMQAQLRNETDHARNVFEYSLALSRRELRAQIWAIEEAVNRGDIAGALRSYDIALRTSKKAPGLLLPNLVAALAEPKVRAALLPILSTGPVWSDSVLQQVATSGIDPKSGVIFFREASAAGIAVTDDLRAGLVNGLIAQGAFEQAWQYYAQFRSGAVRNRSRDPDFGLNPDVRSMFDWTPSTQPGVSVAILQDGEGGLLDFSLPPGTGGALVQQTQMLPAGAYKLQGRSRTIEVPDRSRPYWVLLCRDGRELGRVEVANSNRANGRFEGRLTVPSDCAVQTLSLIARTSDAITGVSGQIDQASLTPIGTGE